MRDRERRLPAVAEASRICSRLKDAHRILTSLDGPDDNVMVIKPPLCFSHAQAEALVQAVRLELAAMRGLDLSAVGRTPT